MVLLDGKATAKEIREELKNAVDARKAKNEKIPHLAAVLVGNDGGSLTYVNAKVKACDQIGFESSLIKYDDSVTEEELLAAAQAKIDAQTDVEEEESYDEITIPSSAEPVAAFPLPAVPRPAAGDSRGWR